MDRGTVLLVDDDPVTLSIVEKRLAHKEHVKVLKALTGQSALECLSKEKPDVIVLDHLLPDTDGIALCRKIKADPRLAGIPIIFFTCFHLYGFEASAEKAGAQLVIDKEDFLELIHAIHEIEILAHPAA